MKNIELLQNYNALIAIQKAEKVYHTQNGRQLLGGRVKLLYAMKKNMKEMLEKLQPYNETLGALNGEYRDREKEEAVYQEAMKQYHANMHKEPSAEPEPPVIFRAGKTKQEYEERIKELLDIEVEDVHIHRVDVMLLDGLELSSGDLEAFMFMLDEE